MNVTILEALSRANSVFQFLMVSDVCIKDLAFDEVHVPLKRLVCLLHNASNTTGGRGLFDRVT